jgi:uncharacterized membrane protein
MLRSTAHIYTNCCQRSKKVNSKEKKEGYIAFVTFLLTFIISLLILSLIGQFLWNSSIVELFTCVRPAKSVWHILGLFLFSTLLLS